MLGMKLNQPLCILCWVTALALSGVVLSVRGEDASQEKLPDGLKVIAIEARPAAVELKHKFDYRQLLIAGKLQSGETVDLTRMANRSKFRSPSAVSISRIPSASSAMCSRRFRAWAVTREPVTARRRAKQAS